MEGHPVHRPLVLLVATLVITTLLLPAGATAMSPGPWSAQSPMEARIGPLIGRWVADDPAYTEGGDAPTAYVMELEWGSPERRHATGRLGGIQADGSERTFWHLFAFWHPHQKRPVFYQVHVDGTLLYGTEVISGEGDATSEVWLVQPDGTMTFARHRIRILDDDTHTTAQLRLDEAGEWQELGTFTWRRVPSGSAP